MFGPYVRVASRASWEAALLLARGRYQHGLIYGRQCLSGADLKGRARRWARKYAQSRENLLVRIRKSGVVIGEEKADHGLRRLVIGDPEVCYRLCDHKGYEYVTMRSKNPRAVVVR
jgi:hypothetical protein